MTNRQISRRCCSRSRPCTSYLTFAETKYAKRWCHSQGEHHVLRALWCVRPLLAVARTSYQPMICRPACCLCIESTRRPKHHTAYASLVDGSCRSHRPGGVLDCLASPCCGACCFVAARIESSPLSSLGIPKSIHCDAKFCSRYQSRLFAGHDDQAASTSNVALPSLAKSEEFVISSVYVASSRAAGVC